MVVEDVFEKWDDSKMTDMEEIESVVGCEKERSKKCEKGKDSDGETDSADEDDNEENKHSLRCKKWFLKHQRSCDRAAAMPQSTLFPY